MSAVENVLDRLDGIEEHRDYWKARCPVHEDHVPSLSISVGDDGRVLLYCFTGCDTAEIVDAMGLTMRDLFESPNGQIRNEGGSSIPPKTTATLQPCNLGNYGRAKGLPVRFLEQLGITDFHFMGEPVLRIPYRNPDASEAAVRFRTTLEKTEGRDDRFRWRKGDKAILYGLERLEKIRKVGYVVLVEGESDTQTLRYHGIAALGVPGASNWKAEWAEYLNGIERIYVVKEPDQGGETLVKKLAACEPIRDRLYVVELREHEDASGLYLDDPESFDDRFKAKLKRATPYYELRRAEEEAASGEALAACRDLAENPDILSRFAVDLAHMGVAGETETATLIYLAMVSRLLPKPVSVVVKRPSSGGKSYLTESVLRFFPESAYYALTAMSERALAYSEEPLSHRMLVIFEAAGMSSDFATYLMRSLLSEGRIRYEVVEKTSEGLKPRLIEREGPTGLLVTTTATRLHTENETRMISVAVTDTREQTRDIMAALAVETGAELPHLDEWHALQTWIETSERRVSIPYASKLAGLIPPVAVRLRRDFSAVLNLIKAHAILHQATRRRDEEGRIIATIEDYAKVRELVADLVSDGIEATVPRTVRETVGKVMFLYKDQGEPLTIAAVAEELQLDKSATWRRVRTAIDRGYLKNQEDRKGRPASHTGRSWSTQSVDEEMYTPNRSEGTRKMTSTTSHDQAE